MAVEPVTRKVTKKENVSYGERVKRRRMDAALQLESGLSKSKRRKLVVKIEKESRNPIKAFEKECNKLYNDLLQSMKKKTDAQANCQALLGLLFGTTSPLYKLTATSDPEEITREYARMCVSRSLQLCLKTGTREQRQTIADKVKDVFSSLCRTNTGHHLCMKMFTYTKDKQETEALLRNLLDHPKTYFSKFGARVWDAAARKIGTSRARHQMLTKLFFEKVVSVEVPKCMDLPLEQSIMSCSERIQKIVKERFFEILDKAVRKELLSSELMHVLLGTLTKMPTFLNEEDLRKLAEAIFDGSEALLVTKDGVWCLNRLCGYWTAKERKTFLASMKTSMALSETSWSAYMTNDADCVFVARLLDTIDDTKLSTENLLCPIFGVKFNKLSIPKLDDQYRPYDVLSCPRACAMLLRICKPSHAKQFMTQQDLQQLDMASPTSKKDAEQRRIELCKFFKALKSLIDLDHIALKNISEKHRRNLNLLFEWEESEAGSEEETPAGDETAVVEETGSENETAPPSDDDEDDETAEDEVEQEETDEDAGDEDESADDENDQ